MLYMKFENNGPNNFRGETFENVDDGRTKDDRCLNHLKMLMTDERRQTPAYTESSPMCLQLR